MPWLKPTFLAVRPRVASLLQKQQQPQQPQQDAQAAALEAQRKARAEARRREQMTYQFAAIAATTGIGATAAFATYYR